MGAGVGLSFAPDKMEKVFSTLLTPLGLTPPVFDVATSAMLGPAVIALGCRYPNNAFQKITAHVGTPCRKKISITKPDWTTTRCSLARLSTVGSSPRLSGLSSITGAKSQVELCFRWPASICCLPIGKTRRWSMASERRSDDVISKLIQVKLK